MIAELNKAKEAVQDFEKSSKWNQYKDQKVEYDKLKSAYDEASAAYEFSKEHGCSVNGKTKQELYNIMLEAEDALSRASHNLMDEYDALKAEESNWESLIAKASNSGSDTNTDTSNNEQLNELKDQLKKAQQDLATNYEKLKILGMPEIDDITDYYINNQDESTKKEYNKLKAQLDEITADYEKAKTEYESLQKQMNSTGTISDNKALLETFTRDLQSYTDKKEAADEILKDIEEDLQAAQTENNKKPEEVENEITKLQNDITTLEKQMKIDSATESKNDVESKYTREDQVKQIEALKKKIETIKAAPEETLVTAPIAGKIVSIDFVPGNSITSGAEVARIEVADKGYICEVSMTTEQARKVQIGAECSIVNSWWYSDVKASVSQIRSDPQSQGQKKIVVITVTGDVSEGQTLNFSIGDRSQSYESVLPKTALREDKEGKFVLVVESKSTPLGVRYKAVRYNVEVVASDDTKCAVSGLYGNESIITTSTSPISDGQQVRLAEK